MTHLGLKGEGNEEGWTSLPTPLGPLTRMNYAVLMNQRPLADT